MADSPKLKFEGKSRHITEADYIGKVVEVGGIIFGKLKDVYFSPHDRTTIIIIENNPSEYVVETGVPSPEYLDPIT